MLKGAPIAFFILLIAGLASGFTGGMMFRGQELANVRSLLELKTGELEELRDLKKRVDDVERKLTQQQISAIMDELKKNPGTVEITKPQDQDGLYGQIEEVFEKSGWSIKEKYPSTGETDFTIRADDPVAAEKIERAFQQGGVSLGDNRHNGSFTLPAIVPQQ